jgi:hypothetical protein
MQRLFDSVCRCFGTDNATTGSSTGFPLHSNVSFTGGTAAYDIHEGIDDVQSYHNIGVSDNGDAATAANAASSGTSPSWMMMMDNNRTLLNDASDMDIPSTPDMKRRADRLVLQDQQWDALFMDNASGRDVSRQQRRHGGNIVNPRISDFAPTDGRSSEQQQQQQLNYDSRQSSMSVNGEPVEIVSDGLEPMVLCPNPIEGGHIHADYAKDAAMDYRYAAELVAQAKQAAAASIPWRQQHHQHHHHSKVEISHPITAPTTTTDNLNRYTSKRKRSSSRDEIFRKKKNDIVEGEETNSVSKGWKSACHPGSNGPIGSNNVISRFLSSHPVLINSLCFASPVRDSRDVDEPATVPLSNTANDDNNSSNNQQRDSNDDNSIVNGTAARGIEVASLGTEVGITTEGGADDETMSSTVYYEATKLKGLPSELNPPMPLFNDFSVHTGQDIHSILKTNSHSSRKRPEWFAQHRQGATVSMMIQPRTDRRALGQVESSEDDDDDDDDDEGEEITEYYYGGNDGTRDAAAASPSSFNQGGHRLRSFEFRPPPFPTEDTTPQLAYSTESSQNGSTTSSGRYQI